MIKHRKSIFSFMALLAVFVAAGALLMSGSSGASAAPLAATKPALKSNIILPGDTAIRLAAGSQVFPDIAAGGGGYLIVWEDSRTNFTGVMGNQFPPGGEVGGQSLKDIYAARLDANGTLIDQFPIVVSQATYDQTRPRVSWNGQNWLVVWNTERVANLTSTVDVHAARISPQGVVLDPNPIVVDGNPTIDELWPTVASNGNEWVVVWMDQGSYFELDATRIAANGTVLNPGGVAFYTPQFPQAPYNADIEFATDEYLITWQEYRSNADDIVGMRLTPNLQRIDQSPFVISSALSYQTRPKIATNGTDFLVAWSDNRSFQVEQPYAARVTHAGQVLDPAGIELNYYFNSAINTVATAWDGTQWVVAWDDSNAGLDVFAARVTTGGTVRDYDGFPVAEGARNQGWPAVVGMPAGGGVRAIWMDDSAGGATSEDIYSSSISSDGVVGTPAPLSLGTPSQRQPDIAAGNNAYLSVFLSEVSGDTRIKAQRLNANGIAIDSEPFAVQDGQSTLRNPKVAWNGTLYLVVWEDYSVGQGFVLGTIFGKRVLPDGTVLDPTPIQIMFGNTPDVAALGTNFLVVDTHEPTNHQRVPKAVRVSTAGVVLGSPATIGTIFARFPHVEPVGNRWLAVWQRNPTHDNPYATVNATFVNEDGTAAGQFLVAPSTSKTPNLATKGDQALIAFYKGGDIRARRITADGTLLDQSDGFAVTSAPNDQFVPTLAWNGSEYVVAYEDYRNVLYLDRPRSDIYASRVTEGGVSLDPNGFVIGNDSTPEIHPVVAALNGSYIVAYADFIDRAPYSAYRIDVQSYQANSTPTPAPTNTSTAVPPTYTPGTPTVTSTSTSTTTSVPPTLTSTVPPTLTSIVPPTFTSVVLPTHTSTATACPIQFSDVDENNTFYANIRCLACQGIVSGYADGTFRPNNQVTRGQLAKMVSNAAGFSEDPNPQIFQDVPPSQTFYDFTNRLTRRGHMTGYECGGVGEPCVNNRPYFRPFANATRGQTSKIVSNAAGFIEPPVGQTFQDVPSTHTFYAEIQRLATRGVMGGYECGGPFEPCVGPESKPYFRPGNDVTRGQSSKIVANAFFPGCNP